MRKSFYKIFIWALISVTFFSFSLIQILNAEPIAKEKELAKQEEELIEKEKDMMKLVYEKMSRRTKECKESINGLFFTLNNLRSKAREEKKREREKEFIAILSDYNSVMGDLGVMQVILDLAEFVEDEKFMEYFDFMAAGFEHLKSSFNLKNELFLKRIDGLKDEDTLRYEKRLLRLFREYFEYDLWREKVKDIIEGEGG